MADANMIQLERLVLKCRHLALQAGSIVRRVAGSGALGTIDKASCSAAQFDPQTEADRQAQALIVGGLRHSFPGLYVIGEEDQSDRPADANADLSAEEVDALKADVPVWPASLRSARLDDVCVWVDPVDGTSEFTKGNFEAVTILIGISIKSIPAVGIIHVPFAERSVWGGIDLGVFDSAGKLKIDASRAERCGVIVSSKSHMNIELRNYLDNLTPQPKKICHTGGCGAKILKVLDGFADAYVYPREGTKKWDTCAGDAIIRAAGGRLSDKYGAELRYDRDVEHMNINGLICTVGPHSRFHDQYLVANAASRQQKTQSNSAHC